MFPKRFNYLIHLKSHNSLNFPIYPNLYVFYIYLMYCINPILLIEPAEMYHVYISWVGGISKSEPVEIGSE